MEKVPEIISPTASPPLSGQLVLQYIRIAFTVYTIFRGKGEDFSEGVNWKPRKALDNSETVSLQF